MPELDRWLKRLLNDLSQPTFDLQDIQPVEDADGTIALSIEPHLIGASIDPDAGHWLGFGDVDALDAPAGNLVLYQIRGLWRDAPERWDALQRPALASHWVATLDEAVARFEDLRDRDLVPDQKGPFLDLTALAVAVVGAPPSRPGLPSLLGFEDRGWLPEPPPPDVRRHVRIRLAGMAPRALLAAVADDGFTRTLNPVIGEGRPKPGEVPSPETMMAISVTRPPDATVVGETRIDDRDAQENGAKYRIAQGDWFGRWGEWATHLGPPKARTAPPAPALELDLPPARAAARRRRPRWPAERNADLPRRHPPHRRSAPGGHPLDRLELSQSIGGGAPAVTTIVLGAPGTLDRGPPRPAPRHIAADPRRPAARTRGQHHRRGHRALDRSGRARLGAERAGAAHDARSAAAGACRSSRPRLLYSARPDATGFARVELVWPSVPGTRYRVFASSEPTLLGALRNAGQTAIADAIAATPAGAPRATAIKAQRALFSWDAFESVTASPIIASGTSTSFVHRVSGSLDVLAAYRVLTEGPSGVARRDQPGRDHPGRRAQFRPAAAAARQPRRARLRSGRDHRRRAARHTGAARPRRADRMARAPVERDGRAIRCGWTSSRPARSRPIPLAPKAPASPSRSADTLKPWRQYRFVVEVQAGPPPGAPTAGEIPVGEWSAPSAAVTLATIPPHLPEPPSALTITTLANGDARLTVTHPHADTLVGTAFGVYRFEVYRLSPGARPAKLALTLERVSGNAVRGGRSRAAAGLGLVGAPARSARPAERVLRPWREASDGDHARSSLVRTRRRRARSSGRGSARRRSARSSPCPRPSPADRSA